MLLPLKAVILSKPRKDGNHLIYFQYCHSSSKRILLSTEIAIPASAWNAKRQCISKSLPKELGGHEALNKQLIRQRKAIETIIERGNSESQEDMYAYVKNAYSPNVEAGSVEKALPTVPKRKKEPDFFDEFDDYIAVKKKKVCERGAANFQTRQLWTPVFVGVVFSFKTLSFPPAA